MTVMATGFLCVWPQHFMGIDVGFGMGCFVYDCGALLMAATFFCRCGWMITFDMAVGFMAMRLFGYSCWALWICLQHFVVCVGVLLDMPVRHLDYWRWLF